MSSAADGLVQLAERVLLDLAHALSADPQRPGELAERPLRAADPETAAQNAPLPVAELAEQRRELGREQLLGHPVVGVLGRWVTQEVAESVTSPLVAGQRLLQGPRPPLGAREALDVRDVDPRGLGELGQARLAALLLQVAALGAADAGQLPEGAVGEDHR